MTKKIYNVEIEVLTGVHIGTGVKLTPLDYTIIPVSSEKKLYLKFSSDAILDNLVSSNKKEQLNEFYEYSDRRDMRGIMNFFHKQISNPVIEYPCDVTERFFRNYKTNLKKDPTENAAEVLQMYRPKGKKTPVIPGSSLKGAMRTAVLDFKIANMETSRFNNLCEIFEKNMSDYIKTGSKLEKELLGYKDAKNDPFRTLLIEDITFPTRNTQLVGMLENIKSIQTSTELQETGMQIQAEVLRGALLGGKAKAEATITIDKPLQKAKVSTERRGNNFSFAGDTSRILSMEEIARACNDFFMSNFDEEYENFYKNNEVEDSIEIITKLKDELEKAEGEQNTFVVRLGRWSQVEFLTFQDVFRRPKTPKRDGHKQSYGTSRTVFDYDGRYVPLGWCKVTYTPV
ncbi:MAG: type III-A CRISPR-associated RAMP protein Csm5 [Treponemataceae bacterium]